jgi:hypothetical protein
MSILRIPIRRRTRRAQRDAMRLYVTRVVSRGPPEGTTLGAACPPNVRYRREVMPKLKHLKPIAVQTAA